LQRGMTTGVLVTGGIFEIALDCYRAWIGATSMLADSFVSI
jgi:hypothetical protein